MFRSSRFKKVSVISFFSLFALAGIFYLGWNNYKDKQPLATVGDMKITSPDLKAKIWETDLKGTPAEPSKVDKVAQGYLLDSLIEEEIIKKEADKLKITATDKEIEDRAKADVSQYAFMPSYLQAKIKENTRAVVLKKKIEEKAVSWKEGKTLIARYDRYTFLKDANKDSDKQHAETVLKDLRGKVASGAVTVDDAIKSLEADSVVGLEAYKPNSPVMSHSFNKDKWQTGDLYSNEAFREGTKGIEKDKISEVFEVKLTGANDKEDGGMLVAVFVTCSNSYEKDKYYSYADWLKDKQREYGVKKYSLLDDQSITKAIYSKLALGAKKLFASIPAFAGCSGGLTPSGSSYPTALKVTFKYIPSLGGDPVALTTADVSVNFNPNSSQSNPWNEPCETSGVYVLPNDTTVPNANEMHTMSGTTGSVSAGSDATVKFGYKGCGGDDNHAFSCYCGASANDEQYYIINMNYTGSTGGKWITSRMYGTDYGLISDNGKSTFKFDTAGHNGETIMVDLIWANEAPNQYPIQVMAVVPDFQDGYGVQRVVSSNSSNDCTGGVIVAAPQITPSYRISANAIVIKANETANPYTMAYSAGCTATYVTDSNTRTILSSGYEFVKIGYKYAGKQEIFVASETAIVNLDSLTTNGGQEPVKVTFYWKKKGTSGSGDNPNAPDDLADPVSDAKWGSLNPECDDMQALPITTNTGTAVTLQCKPRVEYEAPTGIDDSPSIGTGRVYTGNTGTCNESCCADYDSEGEPTGTCHGCNPCTWRDWWKYDKNNGRFEPMISNATFTIDWGDGEAKKTKLTFSNVNVYQLNEMLAANTKYQHLYTESGRFTIKTTLDITASWHRKKVEEDSSCGCEPDPTEDEPHTYSQTETCEYGVEVVVMGSNESSTVEVAPQSTP
ncbi:MAG: hypothetical protein UU65_C0002G0104 [candidate division CPR2 bacterium GW2011_GWC1_41_48]|uniref:Uncharacterized protein n=1 Tax=candidate division CPR2 bacterium GW2011_GWC1_41_48 TaxID=1618344 RepID=A0A0G0YIF6_UNCC2|nr:MAG: hypothetical protein UT47_C0002G0200 [candidate division CPR2 bacterium GW2011_GWC2_39_35]KKR29057.1 MAG: hypothetical protein UT60_C0007G0002 [candidate division CPR2 bacterium GW2011_GWD2_39_7]KKS09326.1 MAG: hypothetical protein UU65_C0002G0104 [candidate division CPR2 bacterium GW2011_GWC1_41_48]OGB70545.1 MAG: hypothetical protein A2Y26_04360 [candidate division CPR2 bacterium GWD2_39_7]